MLKNLLASRRFGFALIFLACAAMLGYALYLQYYRWLNPCPLCIFMRVAVIVLGTISLLAAIHHPRGRLGACIYGSLAAMAALAGLGISARHSWIQLQPPGEVANCGAGLGMMLETMPLGEVVHKVLTGSGECAVIDWTFLGLSMPNWGGIAMSVLLGYSLWLGFKAK
jgi:disulfide bond formation protein DsbB